MVYILLGIHPDRTACGNPISGYSNGECWNPAPWHHDCGLTKITTSSSSVKVRFEFLCPTIALSAESPFLRRWGSSNSCCGCWRGSEGQSQKNKSVYSNMKVWYFGIYLFCIVCMYIMVLCTIQSQFLSIGRGMKYSYFFGIYLFCIVCMYKSWF